MKKKVLSIMAVVLFMSSSFSANTYELQQDCTAYADSATSAELEWTYGSIGQYFAPVITQMSIYNYWLGYCEGAGGNVLAPVFL